MAELSKKGWIKLDSGKFKCVMVKGDRILCNRVFKNMNSLYGHRHKFHVCSDEKRKQERKTAILTTKYRKAETNILTDLHLRISKRVQLFQLSKQPSRDCEAYRHLHQFFLKDGSEERWQRSYYGTIFLAYKLPDDVLDAGLEETIKYEKNNKDFVVYVHCSTSFGKPLCASVRKGGRSPLVEKLENGYNCYHKTFKFKNGTTSDNKNACYLWQKRWKHLGVYKKYFESQFESESEMRFEFLDVNMHFKSNFKGKLSQASFDLAFDYAQTRFPLFPIPKHLLTLDEEPLFVPYLL